MIFSQIINTYKCRMRGFARLLRNQMKRGLIADHGEHLRFLEEVDEERQSSGPFLFDLILLSFYKKLIVHHYF